MDAMRLAILNEREDLTITDDSAMEAVIAKYRRTAAADADPRSVATSFATELVSSVRRLNCRSCYHPPAKPGSSAELVGTVCTI